MSQHMSMSVPWAIPNIQQEDIDYVKSILDAGWYTMGKVTKKFEDDMKSYVGCSHAIAVNNGTSALEVLFRALQLGPGDEVIVPAYSFVATATSLSLMGAKPVFCDIDESMTINPDEVEQHITKKTKAVVAVDFGGSVCEYTRLQEICDKHDLHLLLDGAHSLGSTYKGKSCLQYGLAGTSSFHAAKILTTVEGGMIFTDDASLAETMLKIRSHGELDQKYLHELLGGNYRITDVLAGFGVHQLQRYTATLEKRKHIVDHYKQRLMNKVNYFELTRPQATSNHFLFLLFSEKRKEFVEFLGKHGVDTRLHYPYIIPHQPVYHSKKSFPVAEKISSQAFSLPLYADITSEQVDYVCDQVLEFVHQ